MGLSPIQRVRFSSQCRPKTHFSVAEQIKLSEELPRSQARDSSQPERSKSAGAEAREIRRSRCERGSEAGSSSKAKNSSTAHSMTSVCMSTRCAPKALAAPQPSSSEKRSGGGCARNPAAMLVLSRTEVILGERNRRNRSLVVCMAPDEERLTRRNPLDFPIEWDRPKPGHRPDIFPQFSPMKTPLPPPMPYDPPEEDEEEEEKKEEEEEDPDKEESDQPERQ